MKAKTVEIIGDVNEEQRKKIEGALQQEHY